MKKVKCPYCEGEGQVKDWVDDVLGNTKSFYRDCDCCDGEGEIPEDEYQSAKEVFPITSKEVDKQIESGK